MVKYSVSIHADLRGLVSDVTVISNGQTYTQLTDLSLTSRPVALPANANHIHSQLNGAKPGEE